MRSKHSKNHTSKSHFVNPKHSTLTHFTHNKITQAKMSFAPFCKKKSKRRGQRNFIASFCEKKIARREQRNFLSKRAAFFLRHSTLKINSFEANFGALKMASYAATLASCF
jgi:hypothetical protein